MITPQDVAGASVKFKAMKKSNCIFNVFFL